MTVPVAAVEHQRRVNKHTVSSGWSLESKLDHRGVGEDYSEQMSRRSFKGKLYTITEVDERLRIAGCSCNLHQNNRPLDRNLSRNNNAECT